MDCAEREAMERREADEMEAEVGLATETDGDEDAVVVPGEEVEV